MIPPRVSWVPRLAIGYNRGSRPSAGTPPVRRSRPGHSVQITLYRRSYAVPGSPVSLSFAPDPAGQQHTLTADGRVHEPQRSEVAVTVPDDAKVDPLARVLRWRGASGRVSFTAQEVYDHAVADHWGFQLTKA